MKASASVTAWERVTKDRATKALMATFTWTAVPIKPTTIVASWTVIVVWIDVWIPWIICNGLRETIWSTPLMFYILLICLICSYDYVWAVKRCWRFFFLSRQFLRLLHYHNIFIFYCVFRILLILCSNSISYLDHLHPILTRPMRIFIPQIWIICLFAVVIIRVWIVFCHF